MRQTYESICIVAPKQNCISKIRRAFELLKSEEPRIWKKLLTLSEIRISGAAGFDNELFPKERLWTCQRSVIEKNTIDYIASLLLHEAHHLMQYDRGVRNIDGRAERGAYLAQKRFLLKIGRPEYAKGVMEQYKKINS